MINPGPDERIQLLARDLAAGDLDALDPLFAQLRRYPEHPQAFDLLRDLVIPADDQLEYEGHVVERQWFIAVYVSWRIRLQLPGYPPRRLTRGYVEALVGDVTGVYELENLVGWKRKGDRLDARFGAGVSIGMLPEDYCDLAMEAAGDQGQNRYLFNEATARCELHYFLESSSQAIFFAQ